MIAPLQWLVVIYISRLVSAGLDSDDRFPAFEIGFSEAGDEGSEFRTQNKPSAKKYTTLTNSSVAIAPT